MIRTSTGRCPNTRPVKIGVPVEVSTTVTAVSGAPSSGIRVALVIDDIGPVTMTGAFRREPVVLGSRQIVHPLRTEQVLVLPESDHLLEQGSVAAMVEE